MKGWLGSSTAYSVFYKSVIPVPGPPGPTCRRCTPRTTCSRTSTSGAASPKASRATCSPAPIPGAAGPRPRSGAAGTSPRALYSIRSLVLTVSSTRWAKCVSSLCVSFWENQQIGGIPFDVMESTLLSKPIQVKPTNNPFCCNLLPAIVIVGETSAVLVFGNSGGNIESLTLSGNTNGTLVELCWFSFVKSWG